MKSNLKAYTLVEVLITIILTSIIIVISYSLFTLISKQLLQYQKTNQFDLEYALFNTTINKDIYEAVNYELNDSSFNLIFTNQDNINYSIANRKIVRLKDNDLDTFNLEVARFNFSEKKYNTSKQAEFVIGIKNEQAEIRANFFVKKPTSEIINKYYLNED